MNRSRVVAVARAAAIWIPTLLLVLIFAPQAWNKMSETSGWAIAFRHWGYPPWFRITIGVIEGLAAVLLFWSRTAIVGAVLIIVVMLGGTATHLLKDHGRHLTSEVVPITLATIVLVMRVRAARSRAP